MRRRRRHPSLGLRAAVLAVAFSAAGLGGAVVPALGATPGDSAARSKAAWSHQTGAVARRRPGQQAQVAPRRFAAFTLDPAALEPVLRAAPRERSAAARRAPLVVSVPTPDGTFERFAIAESPVMAPALAAAHPEIATYAGQGVADPTETISLDLTPLGFHAAVRGAGGAFYVDPRYRDQTQYVAYPSDAVAADPAQQFVERQGAVRSAPRAVPAGGDAPGSTVKLRTYRLALLSDPTYAVAVGGAPNVTAAKATLMNRVNQLYEADLAIRMQLIAGNDALNLDTDALATGANGPCGGEACFAVDAGETALACTDSLVGRMDVVAGLLAGARTFDLGHIVLGSTGGGLANLGVVGDANKAGGCTGLTQPLGDAFAVDYVAHEMGHEFGGDHSFNGTQMNCEAGNRAAGTAVEPGSGTTIMGYAGICGSDNAQRHSDPYFAGASIAQLSAYVLGADTALPSIQRAALTGFDGSDAFRLTVDGTPTATITNGTNYTAAGIRDALQSAGSGAVTVTDVTSTHFTVTFGAPTVAPVIALTSPSGLTGYVNDVQAGGPTTHGGTATAGANHAPGVTTAPGFTIPVRTPFALTASGTDVDGNPLTYLWEQNDPGSPTAGTGLIDNAKVDGPLFRVFGTAARYSEADAHAVGVPSPGENAATTDPTRTFPDLPQILAGNTNAASGSCPAADPVPTDAQVDCFSEFLPTASWVGTGNGVMHFRVTARDNQLADGGGVASAGTSLTLAPLAGPFRVTSQAAPQTTSSATPLSVTWDVANTQLPPVSAANVRISLSTDGGATFPTVLAGSTPNDGSETLDLPPLATTQGRIRIEAIGNVFFDVSRADLTITPGLTAGPVAFGQLAPGQSATRQVQIQNPAASPRALGALAVTGDPAFSIVGGQDGCSGHALAPATGSCLVTVRFAPTQRAAAAGTLTGPADDGSQLKVPLTGAGTPLPAPSPARPATPPVPTPVTPGRRGAMLAARVLGRPVVALGVLGHVRLFGTTTSTRIGRPAASRRLVLAVCLDAPCVVRSSASLLTADRRRAVPRRRVLLGTLRMKANTFAGLTLRLTGAQRRAIASSREAAIAVTITADGRRLARTFRFSAG